jgi:hypothetical protein
MHEVNQCCGMLSTTRCGWYIVIHLNCVVKIAEPEPHLRKMPVDIVVEHLGRVRGGKGVNYP